MKAKIKILILKQNKYLWIAFTDSTLFWGIAFSSLSRAVIWINPEVYTIHRLEYSYSGYVLGEDPFLRCWSWTRTPKDAYFAVI